AAFDAAKVLQSILEDRISQGYIIDLKSGKIPNFICSIGTHPNVSEQNIKYTKEFASFLEDLGENDLVIVIVSGGGSAMLEMPAGGNAADAANIFTALTRKGADITEINTVRKHLSLVKGGGLAKIIYPASCISLIFSDVSGDDISMVASGPTIKDATTIADARRVVEKYQILQELEVGSLKFTETPKGHKYFSRTHNFLLVS
ncbi:hypothetical protein CO122_00200, partial [bacterium (Candidatus Gribaldobacteria) CG_4_9_14_3_um_filter_33_9]